MGLEAFFSCVGDFFFLTKALRFKSAEYFNVRQFTVRHVTTVSLFNRQRIMKKCKEVHCFLDKLLWIDFWINHREYTCLLHKYEVSRERYPALRHFSFSTFFELLIAHIWKNKKFSFDFYQYHYKWKAFSKKFETWPKAGPSTRALHHTFASL